MLNESKIKEKIAKILDENTGYEFDNVKALEQIYQLFLPALETLITAKDMITNEYCSHDGKHSSNEECYVDFVYKTHNKLNRN